MSDIDPHVAARLTHLVSSNPSAIAERWVETATDRLRGHPSRSELERDVPALLDAVLAGLAASSELAADEPFGPARVLLADLSRTRARQGFTPSETAVAVFALKDAVLELIGDDPQSYRDHAAFSRLIDSLGLFTFETYAATREQIITEQSEQLLEWSTPVVKLWDGVVAVPLVGTLDSARAQIVMERLLQALVDTGSEHAIIDITGVPAVDTQVAQQLLKTAAAARLMGAECVISGIRPQIAQTIVALGIEFGDIRTKATFADALLSVLPPDGALVRPPRAPRGL